MDRGGRRRDRALPPKNQRALGLHRRRRHVSTAAARCHLKTIACSPSVTVAATHRWSSCHSHRREPQPVGMEKERVLMDLEGGGRRRT